MAKRCFFSFHYQDVIDFRANVVRNHNVTKNDNGGFFDASVWETSKKQGDLALKRLINGGLENTTATVVLIGSQTYARRWVRYEMMKSVERGNLLIGVHINGIGDRNSLVKPQGPNPMSHLGLEVSADGYTGTPTAWNGTKWIYYNDLGAFRITQQPSHRRGKNFTLATWFSTYDWMSDNGFDNFGKWVA